jgi:hypothetical protein
MSEYIFPFVSFLWLKFHMITLSFCLWLIKRRSMEFCFNSSSLFCSSSSLFISSTLSTGWADHLPVARSFPKAWTSLSKSENGTSLKSFAFEWLYAKKIKYVPAFSLTTKYFFKNINQYVFRCKETFAPSVKIGPRKFSVLQSNTSKLTEMVIHKSK